jgi:hypothetical protein
MLSEGHAGNVHGGDRLPWVPFESSPCGDNFSPLTSLAWQVHVYGCARPEIRALCVERQVALHEFGWQAGMERAGLQRDGLYLVRPDGYIGLAAHAQSSASLAAYLDSNAIRLRSSLTQKAIFPS